MTNACNILILLPFQFEQIALTLNFLYHSQFVFITNNFHCHFFSIPFFSFLDFVTCGSILQHESKNFIITAFFFILYFLTHIKKHLLNTFDGQFFLARYSILLVQHFHQVQHQYLEVLRP